MFSKGKKDDSDFTTLYKGEKVITDIAVRPSDDGGDRLYKFKKHISLNSPYEVYLQTEKALQAKQIAANQNNPLEILARKIQRDELLTLSDLSQWINYNFMVFKDS